MYIIIYFFPTYARTFMWQWRQKWHKIGVFCYLRNCKTPFLRFCEIIREIIITRIRHLTCLLYNCCEKYSNKFDEHKLLTR